MAAKCLLAALVDTEIDATSDDIAGQVKVDAPPQTEHTALLDDGFGCGIGVDSTVLTVLAVVTRHQNCCLRGVLQCFERSY